MHSIQTMLPSRCATMRRRQSRYCLKRVGFEIGFLPDLIWLQGGSGRHRYRGYRHGVDLLIATNAFNKYLALNSFSRFHFAGHLVPGHPAAAWPRINVGRGGNAGRRRPNKTNAKRTSEAFSSSGPFQTTQSFRRPIFPPAQLLTNASRSGLMTSACVVNMPCG